MKRIYERPTLLTRILEWLFTLVAIIVLVRMILIYLYQHLGIVIAVVVFVLGSIVGYRIWDYRRRTRY